MYIKMDFAIEIFHFHWKYCECFDSQRFQILFNNTTLVWSSLVSSATNKAGYTAMHNNKFNGNALTSFTISRAWTIFTKWLHCKMYALIASCIYFLTYYSDIFLLSPKKCDFEMSSMTEIRMEITLTFRLFECQWQYCDSDSTYTLWLTKNAHKWMNVSLKQGLSHLSIMNIKYKWQLHQTWSTQTHRHTQKKHCEFNTFVKIQLDGGGKASTANPFYLHKFHIFIWKALFLPCTSLY